VSTCAVIIGERGRNSKPDMCGGSRSSPCWRHHRSRRGHPQAGRGAGRKRPEIDCLRRSRDAGGPAVGAATAPAGSGEAHPPGRRRA